MITQRRTQLILICALIVITIILGQYGRDLSKALDARWLTKYPSAWQIPFKDYISASMKWLVEDAAIGPLSFIEFTRAIAWLIEQPYQFALSVLANGFSVGQGKEATIVLPAVSWIAVTTAVIALGHYCRDWVLAALVGACFLYLAIFGQWDSAMVTLASVLIACFDACCRTTSTPC